MRKTLKILHTIAGGGLVGGLACYMLLLLAAPQDTPAAYADLRQSITLLGRTSPWSLYNEELATYTEADTFNHEAAEGFIHLYGLGLKTYSEVQAKNRK